MTDRAGERVEADPPHTLTEAEWAVMEVVWDKEPCAAGTVQEALQDSRGWAYSTVKTTMDRMVTKGLLATEAIRNLTLFRALVDRDQVRLGEVRRLLRRAFSGAVAPLLQFLVEHEDLSDQDLDDLRKLIRKAASRKS